MPSKEGGSSATRLPCGVGRAGLLGTKLNSVILANWGRREPFTGPSSDAREIGQGSQRHSNRWVQHLLHIQLGQKHLIPMILIYLSSYFEIGLQFTLHGRQVRDCSRIPDNKLLYLHFPRRPFLGKVDANTPLKDRTKRTARRGKIRPRLA